MGKQWQTLFFWAQKSLQMVIAAMKLKDAYTLEGKLIITKKSKLPYFQRNMNEKEEETAVESILNFLLQWHWWINKIHCQVVKWKLLSRV